jgi:hypothetical protein
MHEDAEDYRIFVTSLEDGVWSPARRLHLGGDYSDLYPTISPDNARMAFTSYRPVPGDTNAHPNANLYYVDRTDTGWSAPQLMARATVLENYDAGPTFDANGDLVWISTTPDWRTRLRRRTRWDGRTYLAPEHDDTLEPFADWRDDLYVWDGVVSPDGDLIVLSVSSVDRQGQRGPTDLWAARRTGSGWSEPIRLGAGVNTSEDFENFQFFSRDGRTLYFVRGFAKYYHVSVEAAMRGD